MEKIKKQKKKSIREFVSEDHLKFQLYLIKLSNHLKDLETLGFEETDIIDRKKIDKKIKKMQKDVTKLEKEINNKSSENNISFVIDIINQNIDHLYNSKTLNEEETISLFEEKKQEFINSLKIKITEDKDGTKTEDEELLTYAENVKLSSSTSKEKFGTLLLLMAYNLGRMPSFSGYSDNWKTDFYSNAIEKTLLYLNNFDEDLLSKRSGGKSKAFAYVTQICFNAFVDVINERKKEDNFLKDTISLESTYNDGVKKYNNLGNSKNQDNEINDDEIENHHLFVEGGDYDLDAIADNFNEDQPTNSETFHYQPHEKEIDCSEKDNNHIIDYLYNELSTIKENNVKINKNKDLMYEITYIDKITPIEDKNKDFNNYKEELESKIEEVEGENEINSVIIIINRDIDRSKIYNTLIDSGFDYSISFKKDKVFKTIQENIEDERITTNKSNKDTDNLIIDLAEREFDEW